MLNAVTKYTARQFARAIVMPNLKTPVTTVAAAEAYRQRILDALKLDEKLEEKPNTSFTPLMTCYLTDTADASEIEKGFKSGAFTACKLYPANATTNASFGVTHVDKIYPAFEAMQKIGMPLLIHGEATDSHIDVFDREAVFIEQTLSKIITDFPSLKVVFEHITTKDAVDYVEAGATNLAATITPHHLEFNRNAMFKGGIRPHFYCLPVAKREQHRIALRKAATSGNKKFFLGTDSAPHAIGEKESACGCAGIFNAPHALESYLKVFEEENALDRFEAFASENGPNFYGLPLNENKVLLEKKTTEVPKTITTPAAEIVPFHAEGTLTWHYSGLAD